MAQWQNTVKIGDLLQPGRDAPEVAGELRTRLEALKPLEFCPPPALDKGQVARMAKGLTEELDDIINSLEFVVDETEFNYQLDRLYDLGDTHLWGSPLYGAKFLFVDTFSDPEPAQGEQRHASTGN